MASLEVCLDILVNDILATQFEKIGSFTVFQINFLVSPLILQQVIFTDSCIISVLGNSLSQLAFLPAIDC